jgi:hypothetical protein
VNHPLAPRRLAAHEGDDAAVRQRSPSAQCCGDGTVGRAPHASMPARSHDCSAEMIAAAPEDSMSVGPTRRPEPAERPHVAIDIRFSLHPRPSS